MHLPALTARLQWPRRLLILAASFALVGYFALPRGLHIYLYALLGLASIGYLYARWDETRGQAASQEALRTHLKSELGALREGEVLHLRHEGRPILIKTSVLNRELQVAVLTPMPESSLAFRLYREHTPRPPLDGGAMALGAADLEPLPGLSATLPQGMALEGNAPAQIARLFDNELRDALARTTFEHRDSFRGLSFDGRFLGAHWTLPLASRSQAMLEASWDLFVPFIPQATPRAVLLS